MKKIIFLVIIIFVVYHYRESIPVVRDLIHNKSIMEKVDMLKNSTSQKLSEQTVTDELKTWVLKDGIKLPQDWTLKEQIVGTEKVSIIIPPKPNSTEDFIVLHIKKENTVKLPKNHTCKEMETHAVCLVGNNYETLKTFSVLTFVKQ